MNWKEKRQKMTRMLKYMVYNPKAGKPTKYHDTYDEALKEAERINVLTRDDILVLKVIAKVETRMLQNIEEIIKELR